MGGNTAAFAIILRVLIWTILLESKSSSSRKGTPPQGNICLFPSSVLVIAIKAEVAATRTSVGCCLRSAMSQGTVGEQRPPLSPGLLQHRQSIKSLVRARRAFAPLVIRSVGDKFKRGRRRRPARRITLALLASVMNSSKHHWFQVILSSQLKRNFRNSSLHTSNHTIIRTSNFI